MPTSGLRILSWSRSIVDLDADAAELAFDRALEAPQLVAADVVGVGIELASTPSNGRFHQFAAADRLDVVPLDLVERVGKHLIHS